MFCFEVNQRCAGSAVVGPQALALMRYFGMSMDRLRQRRIRHRLSLTVSAGQICCITGPSGSGKSVLLGAMAEQVPIAQRAWLTTADLPDDRAVIDCFDGPLHRTLPALTRAGLGDAWTLLQPPATLSDGQRWRFQLAQILCGDKHYIFADEFCAPLDATTALVIAYHLRRCADRTGRTFILACGRDDLLAELKPDILIVCSSTDYEVIHRKARRKKS